MKQLNLEKCGKPIVDSIFVVLDCETTGLSPHEDAITEIAAIKICGGKEIGTFHTLLNPQQEVPRRISALTGITNENLKDSPTFENIASSLSGFIGNEIIVGHNVVFDLNFINASLERYGFETLTNRNLDTLRLAKKIIPGEVSNFKLATLAAYCKSETLPEHRAFADVKATIDVLHYLIERTSSLGVAGIDDLFRVTSVQKRSRFLKKSLSHEAPSSPGVYIFISDDNTPLYIGTSKNIRNRLRSYFTSDDRHLISKMLRLSSRIEYIQTPTALEARIAEIRLLQKLRPQFNIRDTKVSKQFYVYAQKNELAPTFRVSNRTISSAKSDESLRYGPLNSRRNAELFKDALNHAFKLRKCDLKCENIQNTTQIPCLNSLKGLHSCFCSGDWTQIDDYVKNFESNVELFESEYSQMSRKLIAEMNELSRDLKFEKAKQMFEYVQVIQKWMDRFSILEDFSRFSSPANDDLPEVRSGIAQIRTKVEDHYLVAFELNKILRKCNESPLKDEDNFSFPADELRERFYLAIFLSKKNLLNSRLKAKMPKTVVTDQKNIKVTTIP